ncbi:hypothetical protein JJB63_12730 [Clostridium perfringens]|uniref:YopX family protein n=1 Tax=Clostridium perfringens TaxID=1502 RepID=UPI001ABA4B4C|nr:YopX family protein [Clostridium perfringens]MBO3326455.1 hypothetical protein [Clostridium perfringens]
MSRELKFKIWDKEQKKFLEINWEGEDTTHTKGKANICYSDHVYVTLSGYVNEDGWPYEVDADILQYTGLKDKNGKEIYEGDVLERHGYWPIRIEYDKGCLMVRDLDEVRYNNLILNVPICNFESINDWKVIGNIYENPELLEREK